MGNTPDGYKAFRGEFVNGAYTGYTDTLGRPVAGCVLLIILLMIFGEAIGIMTSGMPNTILKEIFITTIRHRI